MRVLVLLLALRPQMCELLKGMFLLNNLLLCLRELGLILNQDLLQVCQNPGEVVDDTRMIRDLLISQAQLFFTPLLMFSLALLLLPNLVDHLVETPNDLCD